MVFYVSVFKLDIILFNIISYLTHKKNLIPLGAPIQCRSYHTSIIFRKCAKVCHVMYFNFFIAVIINGDLEPDKDLL